MKKNRILVFLSTIFSAVFIKILVADIYTIPTPSMSPTLQINDKILLQKRFFSIKKKDIVAFFLPQNPNEKLIKRCVGVPLDTLILDTKNELELLKKNTQNTVNQYFVIPKKGLTITIDTKNIAFYKPLIEQSEDGQVSILNAVIYINGEIKNTYTFKENYYFMLGDNPTESFDSRQLGLVAENLVFGKIVFSIHL
jgi:signal peptidase I